MSVRQDIKLEWVSSFCHQLHELIQYWKMDKKVILHTTKLVKKHIQYLLEWDTSSQPR